MSSLRTWDVDDARNQWTVEYVAEQIDRPLEQWAAACHDISLAIVNAELIDGARVARGHAQGISSQHSWVAIPDCYSPKAVILDPTWWWWRDEDPHLWWGSLSDGEHWPHGYNQGQSIWDWGRPERANGDAVELDRTGLSETARSFLDVLGPIDRDGWAMLLNHAPVSGWPADEIYAAADRDPRLSVLIPIDRLGMLTDRNPGGLYLPGEETGA